MGESVFDASGQGRKIMKVARKEPTLFDYDDEILVQVITMDDRQLALFDYGTLDIDTRFFVQTKTAEIRILVKQTANLDTHFFVQRLIKADIDTRFFVQRLIKIGQGLIEVKEKLSHDDFVPWLGAELGWSIRTAHDYMNLTKVFKSATFADLNMFL